jgi:hypothetical protein
VGKRQAGDGSDREGAYVGQSWYSGQESGQFCGWFEVLAFQFRGGFWGSLSAMRTPTGGNCGGKAAKKRKQAAIGEPASRDLLLSFSRNAADSTETHRTSQARIPGVDSQSKYRLSRGPGPAERAPECDRAGWLV